MQNTNTEAIKQSNSCVDILSRQVELRKVSGKEWAGACPKCGGDDRLHVTDSWFFCRKCHEKHGDVIELADWLYNLGGFLGAVRWFGEGVIPEATNKIQRTPSVDVPLQRCAPDRLDLAKVRELEGRIVAACQRLDAAVGVGAREYLASRGITLDTARAWWLGVEAAWDIKLNQKRPAVCLPWIDGDIVTGIKNRFLTVPEGGQRFTSAKAYERAFALNVFGRHILGGAYNVLLLVEGEINAVSCWQALKAAKVSGVDVLSIGSESLPDRRVLADVAGDFRRVICWVDKPDKAAVVRAAIPSGEAIRTPYNGDEKLDANVQLQHGILADFLAANLAWKPAKRAESLPEASIFNV